MKKDIVLAGVGGQGILTIAAIIARAAMKSGLRVKQSEVHGMSQRGGSVEAHLRLSSEPIFSDLIAPGTADVVLAVEPMEALRQERYLAQDGVILSNAKTLENIADYPSSENLHAEIRRHKGGIVLDADGLAVQAGNARAMNMVMLGAISFFLGMEEHLFTDMITEMFASKGEAMLKVNLEAFALGKAAAEQGLSKD